MDTAPLLDGYSAHRAAAVLTNARVAVCPSSTTGGAPVAALLHRHQHAEGTTA